MPCNSLHLLLSELEACTKVPVLSIVDAVVQEVGKVGCDRVGLLATEATLRTGLYQRGLDSHDIDAVCLKGALNEVLMDQIKNEVRQSAAPEHDTLGDTIASYFESQGAGVIVAGCTELAPPHI